tara:strand:+ start:1440 stop:2831 length:1392 start_codon:yes stop_codon:yes gene_type:complete
MKVGNINTTIANSTSVSNLQDSLIALDKIKWDPVFDVRTAASQRLGIGEDLNAPLFPALRTEPDSENVGNENYVGLVFRSTWDNRSPEFIPSQTFMQQFFGSNYAGLGSYYINSMTDQMNIAAGDSKANPDKFSHPDNNAVEFFTAAARSEYMNLSRMLLDASEHYIKYPPRSDHGLKPVDRMIRTYSQPTVYNVDDDGNATAVGHSGILRSFHSGQYKKLDNINLVKSLFDGLDAGGIEFHSDSAPLQLESANIGEDKMFLKFVNYDIGGTIDGKDINYMLTLSNSETAKGGLWVRQGTFIQICSNGMIRENIMHAQHKGAKGIAKAYASDTVAAQNDVLWRELRDDITAAMTQENMDKILNEINPSTQVLFSEPKKVVDDVQNRLQLSDKENELVYANLLRDESDFGMSQFALSNAVTKTAQEVSSYERSTELEEVGNKVLQLPEEYFSRKDFHKVAVAGV